jgi:hypothetical protein
MSSNEGMNYEIGRASNGKGLRNGEYGLLAQPRTVVHASTMKDGSTKENRIAEAVAMIKEAVRTSGMATFKMGTMKASEWAEVLERLGGDGTPSCTTW